MSQRGGPGGPGRPPFGHPGGPPPRPPVVGSSSAPVNHPFPGQSVDPREFVGPNPTISAPKPMALKVPGGPRPLPVAPQAVSVPAPPERIRLDDFFLSRLPAQGLQYWHRKRVVRGSTAVGAIGVFRQQIDVLPQGLALVAFHLRQTWYDAGLDPLDPDALTAFQDDQPTYGRVGLNLLINGGPVFDARENLVDPNGGLFTARVIFGFSRLNENLLYLGEHPTALYIRDNATIEAAWTTLAVPGHVPTAVGVEVRGYTVPFKKYQEILAGVRGV